MAITSDAKRLLAETIRGSAQDPAKGLRHRLLEAIRNEAAGQYRLAVPLEEAGLDEAHRRRRERLDEYLDEKTRTTEHKNEKEQARTRERLLRGAEKEAAATLLNRLITLRLLEASGLSRPSVVTGGWNSKGYREFREFGPALLGDETEGYAFLLQLVFAELAADLPGLFGDVGVTGLFPIPAKALRDVVEALDNPELASAWTDDVTLGWVYQYWNDPDREALDAKISDGGKIEPHEIASKTQMFTERYMVEWLLQNSLGLTWLAMCKKHGWAADAGRVLPLLDERRADWRKRREARDVALDALMPIEGDLEEHWKYYVPQPIPDDAIEKAPKSVRTLKILDPACGSGHFLVIAFGLLAALYREEARHLGRPISDREIAESILENNLHGIDIDPRAIQIAAAGLYVRAKTMSKECRPKRLNLVAPVFQLGKLPKDDPAVAHLRDDLKREAGIPEELTNKLLGSLAGVDYLGSLLKVDAAVEDALKNIELSFERTRGQGDLFGGFPAQQVKLSMGEAKATVLDKLELFLERHSTAEDLGLRLDGEQLVSGIRFVRMAREGAYDVVVGNPPYQGLTKADSFEYVARTYPRGKADLYASFLERSLQFARPGGTSALLTMRGWMFLGQFAELRKALLKSADLRLLGDVDRGAFEDVPDEVLSTVMSVFRNAPPTTQAISLQPTAPEDRSRDGGRTSRKRAALLAQVGRYEFDPRGFRVIEGEPIVYWWSRELLERYAAAPKLGDVAPVRTGVCTSDNTRFLRRAWEVRSCDVATSSAASESSSWAPFVSGAKGSAWLDEGREVCLWRRNGLEMKAFNALLYGSYSRTVQNEAFYFRRGVAFTMIGSTFAARAYRGPSIMGKKGSSVFPADLAATLCSMNRSESRRILTSLNPGIGFEVGDVNRLPNFAVRDAGEVFSIVEQAFLEHESASEPSLAFRHPGPSPWRHAQAWAQRSVDEPEGTPLRRYLPNYDAVEPESQISFFIGVALGRFGGYREGILDTAPPTALPNGILFVSAEGNDDLEHTAASPLREAWKDHGANVGEGNDVGTYLRKSFFDFHKKLYENRPTYLPLSSARKSFVAFVSIHRWADDTLNVVLADHLIPTKRRLEGEIEDLRTARASGANKGKAEKRFTDVQKLLEELSDFIAKVTEVAERGAPSPDEKTTKREGDARFVMDLDDGVMINSAALWPLLEPQWKDPKKWWKELANAQGKKDYDWSHLAARYFPTRVREKCEKDPSLAVAHKCFWELHPAKAYAWELRLQDEIRPDFTIDEPGSDEARAKFLAEKAAQAKELLAAEMTRRERKAAKADDQLELTVEAETEESEEDADA